MRDRKSQRERERDFTDTERHKYISKGEREGEREASDRGRETGSLMEAERSDLLSP